MIHRSAMVAIGLIAAMAYVVLLGGTARGEVEAELRIVNAILSAVVILAAGGILAGGMDRVDGLAIAALALFAMAALVSEFPRQSFDAVLSAFTYVAALVIARRAMARVRARRWLVRGLIGLSAFFTLVFTGVWLVRVLEWWQATGWQVVPPLNFELGSAPWGHRHDVALLIVMLYPAWWTGEPGRGRRALAIAFGVLGGLLVLVDGSRALWLAMIAATGVLATPWIVRRLRAGLTYQQAVIGLVALGAAFGLAVVSGFAAAFLQRATNAATLGYRAELWGAIVDAWSSRPIAGFGPGSFPWVLQTTDYFDTNGLAPRHPDSAIMQMLAEGGIVGIVALAVLVGGVGVAVMRSRPRAARWALLTFVGASLNANPTDFAFLIVVAIGWTAYAIPFRAVRDRVGRAAVPYGMGAAIAVAAIGVAYVPTLAAGWAYDRGRDAVAEGDLVRATFYFEEAFGADAGMALYPRQLGTAQLLQGDVGAAVADLESATRINPWDDLAWRTLAVGLVAAGDTELAEEAIGRAVQIQRSDPTNLLLAGIIGSAADEGLPAEVVQAWPWIVYAVGWEEWLPPGVETDAVIAAALERWEADEPMPEGDQGQGLWLAAMGGDDDAVDGAIEQSGWGAFGDAMVSSIRCEPVGPTLDAMGVEAFENHLYWWLRIREAVMAGESTDESLRVVQLMGRAPPGSESTEGTLDPLDENGGYSTDRWGYRRLPISWPDAAMQLPSPGAGMARWFHEGC